MSAFLCFLFRGYTTQGHVSCWIVYRLIRCLHKSTFFVAWVWFFSFPLPNSLWSCYNYSNEMEKVPRSSCGNYFWYCLDQFGFFCSSPTSTNICTLSVRTAWEQSEKKPQTMESEARGTQSPSYLWLLLFYSFFLNTTTEKTQCMRYSPPKPTPNWFAVHLSQQGFTPASSDRAFGGCPSMTLYFSISQVYLCDVFSRSGSFSISALWFMLILAISPPSLPSEPV